VLVTDALVRSPPPLAGDQDESVHGESVQDESVHGESIQDESVHGESIQDESVHGESIPFRPEPSGRRQDESVTIYVSVTDIEDPSGRCPPRRPYGPVWGRAPVRVGSSDRDEHMKGIVKHKFHIKCERTRFSSVARRGNPPTLWEIREGLFKKAEAQFQPTQSRTHSDFFVPMVRQAACKALWSL